MSKATNLRSEMGRSSTKRRKRKFLQLRHVLEGKKHKDIDFIECNETVLRAIGKMSSKKIGALLVKDKDDIVGTYFCDVAGLLTIRYFYGKGLLEQSNFER